MAAAANVTIDRDASCFARGKKRPPESASAYVAPPTGRVLLLGVFSFLSLNGARQRRDALRDLWRTDANGIVGGVTTRFLMLREDLDVLQTRGGGGEPPERQGDLCLVLVRVFTRTLWYLPFVFQEYREQYREPGPPAPLTHPGGCFSTVFR